MVYVDICDEAGLPSVPKECPAVKGRQAMQNHVRAWREARGLSQRQLAQKLGVNNSHISRLEIGARMMTTKWLDRIADALGIDPLQLMAGPPGAEARMLAEAGGEHFIMPDDTMEPTIMRGDRLVVEHAESLHSPGIYVIAMPNRQVVCRVQPAPSSLKVTFDNRAYEGWTLEAADAHVIGRVTARLHAL